MTPVLAIVVTAAGLAPGLFPQGPATRSDPHADHIIEQQASAPSPAARNQQLPPDADAATAQLKASPRHAEWVDVPMSGAAPIKSFVVYPERREKAPVVIVI